MHLLNTNTRELSEQDYQFLTTTGDTLLTKACIQASNDRFLAHKLINDGFAEKKFDQVIEACQRLLNTDDDKSMLHNNIGYALLGKKQYEQAIESFTRLLT